MAKRSMSDYAKGWKSPEERREAKSAGLAEAAPPGEKSSAGKKAAEAKERSTTKKVAKAAPADSTKGRGKDSRDSKDGGKDGWHSAKSMKKPKGAGC